MLVVHVSINNKIIDLIYVHNTGNKDNIWYEYEIINPNNGERLVEETIWHNRSLGYRPLLSKVLDLLDKYQIEEIF